MQQDIHAVIYWPAVAGVQVLPLPLAKEDVPEGWEIFNTFPDEQAAQKAATDLGQALDPEFCGSIH